MSVCVCMCVCVCECECVCVCVMVSGSPHPLSQLPGSTLAASIGLALRLLRDCAVLPTSRQMGWARKSHMDLIDQNIKYWKCE